MNDLEELNSSLKDLRKNVSNVRKSTNYLSEQLKIIMGTISPEINKKDGD